MAHTQPQFGQAVADLLKRRGLSQNQASIRSGLDRFTIARMIAGIPPRLDLLEEFARAFDEDVNAWRALAGYPTVEEGFNPAAALFAGLAELEAEFGRPILFSTQDALFRQASPESIEQMLANLRADMEREDARDRQGGGSPGGAMLMASW